MSVIVPRYDFSYDKGRSASPYGFAFTTSALDLATDELTDVLPDLGASSLSLKRPRFFCAMRSNVPPPRKRARVHHDPTV